MYGQHLAAVLDHLGANQCRVGAHAYNILIVIVVWNRVDVHRVGKGLAFGCRGRGRELAGLHSVVQPENTQIQERRKYAVDSVVEKIVHLPFGQHCHPGKGDFQLVHLIGNVISVEISAVIDIAALLVHNRIVIDCINLILKHLPRRFDLLIHRPQDLRNASERIIWLDFLLENPVFALMEEFCLTISEKAAPCSEVPHH